MTIIRKEAIHINQIKRLRINKELTQQELAKACGVTQGTVALWEKGICFPKAEKIPALSKALECDTEELLRMAESRLKRKVIA